MNDEQPTHLDLFSGIGGFAIAAAWAGFRTIGFSEIEPYACKILKQHWPDVPNFGDIRNVRGIKCDLITGGFPCQPFSVAGKRRGKKDDRHLWPEMLRVIEECNPAWVLAENVAGFASMVEWNRVLKVDADGNAIGEVGTVVDRVGRFICCEAVDALIAIGYEVQAFVIPACAVDAKHRRDRIWIVGHSASSRWQTFRTLASGNESSSGKSQNPSSHAANSASGVQRTEQEREREMLGRGQDIVDDGSKQFVVRSSSDHVENSGSRGRQSGGTGRRGKIGARSHAEFGKPSQDSQSLANANGIGSSAGIANQATGKERNSTIADNGGEIESNSESNGRDEGNPHTGGSRKGTTQGEQFGLAGFCRWQPEPDVGRVAHGVPNRSHRLKALGNAILPQVAYQILKLMR